MLLILFCFTPTQIGLWNGLVPIDDDFEHFFVNNIDKIHFQVNKILVEIFHDAVHLRNDFGWLFDKLTMVIDDGDIFLDFSLEVSFKVGKLNFLAVDFFGEVGEWVFEGHAFEIEIKHMKVEDRNSF